MFDRRQAVSRHLLSAMSCQKPSANEAAARQRLESGASPNLTQTAIALGLAQMRLWDHPHARWLVLAHDRGVHISPAGMGPLRAAEFSHLIETLRLDARLRCWSVAEGKAREVGLGVAQAYAGGQAPLVLSGDARLVLHRQSRTPAFAVRINRKPAASPETCDSLEVSYRQCETWSRLSTKGSQLARPSGMHLMQLLREIALQLRGACTSHEHGDLRIWVDGVPIDEEIAQIRCLWKNPSTREDLELACEPV